MIYTLFVNEYHLTADTREVLVDLLGVVFNLNNETIEELFSGDQSLEAKDGKLFEVVAWNN